MISPKPGLPDLPHHCSSLMISMKFDQHKKRLCWSKNILQGACPCLPQPQFTGSMPLLSPSHSLQGACPCLPPATVYREHALAYPSHSLQGACPCLPPATVYRSMTLLTPSHSLQGACPCLPQSQFTGSMP